MNTQPLPRLNIPKKASKADVRSMLGLQAKDDAYWSKFEWASAQAYKDKISLNPGYTWGELPATEKANALAIVAQECSKENITGVVIHPEVLEWRVWVLHASAKKWIEKQKKSHCAETALLAKDQASSASSASTSGSALTKGPKLFYDPVREAYGDAR